MNAKTFDEIVESRAQERAKEKIHKFKVNVSNAFQSLTGDPEDCRYNKISEKAKEILSVMISDNANKNWPKWIFENEKKRVQKELLNIMDEMQKAFLAVDKAKNVDDPNDKITWDESGN